MSPLPDLNLDGVTADHLVDLLRHLPRIIDPLERLTEAAPCITPSAVIPSCVDLTPGLGTVLAELLTWVQEQEARVFNALVETPEKDPLMADVRSYAILAHMAKNYAPMGEIAERALRLDREDAAAVARYKARKGHLDVFKRGSAA